MRDFTVKQGVMGYIVTIGCQVAGFTTKEDLLKEITEYVNDPEATEKKYYNPLSGMASVDRDPIHPGNPYGVSLSEPCEPVGVTIGNATVSNIPYAEVVASGSVTDTGIEHLRETIRARA
jgi:hypothetical protein